MEDFPLCTHAPSHRWRQGLAVHAIPAGHASGQPLAIVGYLHATSGQKAVKATGNDHRLTDPLRRAFYQNAFEKATALAGRA